MKTFITRYVYKKMLRSPTLYSTQMYTVLRGKQG